MLSRNFLLGLLMGAAPFVSANCTEWSNSRWQSDGTNGYSTLGFIPLETLACPSANKTCTIPRRSYDLTVERKLNISASADDIDGIFELARANFGRPDFNAQPFITRNTTVSTFDISNLFVDVKPGQNKTLGWVPYFMYSYGTLGGCSNASLNGVGVMTSASYLRNDTRNTSSVGGAFSASARNIADKSAASSLQSSGMTGVTVGSMGVLLALLLSHLNADWT